MKKFDCNDCKNKRYVVVERADGSKIIERCDACSQGTPFMLTDADAAMKALQDGYPTTDTYPFVVLETPEEREKLLAALTPRDREVIEDVMAQNPGLTAAETIRHARAMGM
jgi:hypothetical protein